MSAEIGPPVPVQPARRPAPDRERVDEERRRRARSEQPPRRPPADADGHIDTYA